MNKLMYLTEQLHFFLKKELYDEIIPVINRNLSILVAKKD
jgi:hypothetical protein